MSLWTLFKAGVALDLYWIKNNRAAFITELLWPYMILGLILGAGYVFGNPAHLSRNLGVKVNPITYFVASTTVAFSCMAAMWGVSGSILFLRWVGVLPYVVLAPHRFSATLVLSYIPRYLLGAVIQLLEFTPIILMAEGLELGLVKLGVLAVAQIVGMLPLLGFSALLAALIIIYREETNFLNWLNPLILLLSGVFYPVYFLPYWARLVAAALPSTYTVELARLAALMGSPKLAPMTALIGVLAAMTVVYNMVAMVFMGAGERRAMREGAI